MAANNPHTDPVTIGRLSCLAQVGVDTVRFYERSGLLESWQKTDSGYRLYSLNTIVRIKFIRRARAIGLTVKQIKTILEMHDTGGSDSEVRDFATSMAAQVEEQISGLSKWHQLLIELTEHCDRHEKEHIDKNFIQALMRNQCDKSRH